MSECFPATYSTLSAGALATAVLPDFGLGAIADCRLYSLGINDTYQVRAASGAGYYLRVYRAGRRSLEDVSYELALLNHLHEKGVSVARPLPRKSGSLVYTLSAPEGERYAVLFTAAPGKEPSYKQDAEGMAFKYGRAVAEIHNALDDFDSQHQRFGNDLEHLIDKPLANVRPLLSHRPSDWEYVQRLAETVRQRILNLPASGLELGACHGDLQGYHAHIDEDGTMTFYDFDFCGYGFRAYDLAVFRWCARLDDQEDIWWPPYLRGYQERRELNGVDVEATPLFVAARHIWHMGLHTGNVVEWGYGDLGDSYFDRRLKWLRSLEADYLADGS